MDTTGTDNCHRHKPPSWHFVPQKRRLLPEDPFYEDGNIHCSVQHKQIPMEDEEETRTIVSEFPCHVSGCAAGSFTTVQDYEVHYNSAHRNVCDTCNRVFPSVHLLEIHVMEWHDAMFQVLAHKQHMFLCLVQSCGIKFKTAEERKLHLVREHHYPKDFRFDRRAKHKGNVPQSESRQLQTEDDSMDVGASNTVCHSPSTDIKPAPRQYRVPKTISFGRGGVRTFQRPHPQKPHQGKKHNKQKKHKKTNAAAETRRSNPVTKTNFEQPDQQMNTHANQESCERTMSEPPSTEAQTEVMESQVTMDTR